MHLSIYCLLNKPIIMASYKKDLLSLCAYICTAFLDNLVLFLLIVISFWWKCAAHTRGNFCKSSSIQLHAVNHFSLIKGIVGTWKNFKFLFLCLLFGHSLKMQLIMLIVNAIYRLIMYKIWFLFFYLWSRIEKIFCNLKITDISKKKYKKTEFFVENMVIRF